MAISTQLVMILKKVIWEERRQTIFGELLEQDMMLFMWRLTLQQLQLEQLEQQVCLER